MFDNRVIGQSLEQLSCKSFLYIGITLQVLSIDANTTSEKERLNNSVNCVDTSLLSSFKIFVEILFGPIDFKGSRDKTMFLISVLSAGLMKKVFMSIG